MKTLSEEPKVIALANALHLHGPDSVRSVVEFCRQEVARLVRGCVVQSIWDLDRIVCAKLNLTIHEIWNDEELRKLSHGYASEDPVFAALSMELNPETYGVLYQRKPLGSDGNFQYVAFVDCRGEKAAKRFFTRWHEIAHRLTTVQQFEMPFRRTSVTLIDKDPEEKLMDLIAGEIGFFEPLFSPLLNAEIRREGKFTFELVETIRAQFCPDASFQSTLNACAIRLSTPVLIIEVGMAFKKSELRAIHSPQLSLLPSEQPKFQPRLRVLTCLPNPAARKVSLRIPRNMRVPSRSLITKVFKATEGDDQPASDGIESLSWWTSSDSGALPHTSVDVQARKVNENVLAIVAPVGASSR